MRKHKEEIQALREELEDYRKEKYRQLRIYGGFNNDYSASGKQS